MCTAWETKRPHLAGRLIVRCCLWKTKFVGGVTTERKFGEEKKASSQRHRVLSSAICALGGAGVQRSSWVLPRGKKDCTDAWKEKRGGKKLKNGLLGVNHSIAWNGTVIWGCKWKL